MKRQSIARGLIGGIILVIGLILVLPYRQPESAATEMHAVPATASGPGHNLTNPDAPHKAPDASTPDPRVEPHPSLAGTDVNGGIRVDQNGRVVLHRDVRRMFDYYLSLRGRMENDAIRALLRQHLEASESRDVVNQALALFDKYVALIDAEIRLADEWTQRDLKASAQVATVLEERRNLRRTHLGDDLAEAFFEEQESYEDYQLERMKIGTDPNLSEAEKAEALAAAENRLTPQQQEIRKQTFAWLDIKQLARQPIESLNVESADAIRQRFGENALDRLAAVEQERKTWEQKRQAYRDEKARLEARTDLSDDEKKASLLDYVQAHLDDSEWRRMQALDSVEGELD
ncbi:MAG TPA: lipase secretion chaperone [Oligoflexus sp.]|uniref:lipase secretion chaperone n=1 Tax=Oligoflexus sp. TaxID=1971216 RepID=UPI002D2717C3|nr:lipase secretion chaperone [Oligoflexus sp.]HYX31610.1 lipase secretion chaperone [Oligoflexus sp.]